MTVASLLNKITYPGNGATTSFTFSFAFPFGTAAEEQANFEVIYTDPTGINTVLTEGPGSSQYQITFNPPAGQNPTPVGGSVLYNPLGTPIPSGSFLTIIRLLPAQQNTSIPAGTLYPPVLEEAFDYDVMLLQQFLEQQNRAIVVPVSDPIPTALPPVAARANQIMGFDNNGNPIAFAPGGASTPVSSAMAPVVGASTLAGARSAMGLGNIAPLNAGAGLAIFGGSLVVNAPLAADAGPTVTVDNTFYQNVRIATALVTYNLQASSVAGNNFNFWVYATGGQVNLTPQSGDRFQGMGTGTTYVIPSGMKALIATDGSGVWYTNIVPGLGVNAPLNCSLSATVSTGALTIALKDSAGNDPSSASPVVFTVQNGTAGIAHRAVTAPLSITVPSGATLGTTNGQANRIWVGLFDNAGTPVLGVYNSYNGNVVPWNETLAASGTGISAGSGSAQVWYTASAVASKFFKPLGYVESTQGTAGNWATGISAGALFGPGVKRPGDILQTIGGTTSSTISLSSPANVVNYSAGVNISLTNAVTTATWKRGATTLLTENIGVSGAGISVQQIAFASLLDAPNTTSSTTYAVAAAAGGTAVSSLAQEIQI